jgi:AcrR family transcriptional regulator
MSDGQTPKAPGAPGPARGPQEPPIGADQVREAMESARAALAATRQAAQSSRQAAGETRDAVARARLALRLSAEETRRAAELASRDASGDRLSRAESRTLTRERLLDAAAEVFNRLGYHGASLEAVAEAAGYTKGAVYSNFATKGDLFIALHRRYTAGQLQQQLAAMANLSLDQLADQGGEMLIGQAREREQWDLLQIEFWLAAMRDPDLRASMARSSDEFWEVIGALFGDLLQRAGAHPAFTGVEFAKLVNALGSGLLLQLYLDPDFVDASVFARAIRALAGAPADETPADGAPVDDVPEPGTPPEPPAPVT